MRNPTNHLNPIHRMLRVLKHNRLSVEVLNRILELRCRDVEAYVFVASPGRSGSATLAKIFELVEDGVSLHEPTPKMLCEYPAGADRDKYFQNLFLAKKRIYINTAAAGKRYYFETNHQFIKNFAKPAIEYFGNKIRIVHLLRDPVSVASSFFRLNSIPGRTGTGKYYLLDPAEDTNLIKAADLLGSYRYKHDLFKCLWYWYEVEARISATKRLFPNVLFYEIKTEQLNDIDKLREMFEFLQVEIRPEKLGAISGARENTRRQEVVNKFSFDECVVMNEQLRAVLESRYGREFWT